jgi:hypothetical protein
VTVSDEQALIAAAEEFLADVGEGLWSAFLARGVAEGSLQEVHVTWRCPSIAAAEALESAARALGNTVAAAPPHAEAKGPGFGVAVTVPFDATRQNLDDALLGIFRLGAGFGATVAGIGTMFHH